ncbi:hypothetical protein R3P38DRAFT_2765052 [Favolaschia claudopus]|uniref:Uncharacterized protein n=1 Tax=Favolaschia claudopus TaxID=2862362 RepID=A0AAW0D0V4_9AGAR
MSQMVYKPWLELKRLNGARRVDYHWLNRTGSRHKCTGSIEYVSLIGLQDHALQVSGLLARFRDIDFNRYRHCVDPNTPIEAIRNRARQHQSRGVKVGDNSTARTLSFGKEIEEHTMQQGSARNVKETKVIGVKGTDVFKQRPTIIRPDSTEPSYLTRELGTQFHAKGPKTRGIRGNNDSVGGNRGQHRKNASRIEGIGGNSWNREQLEFSQNYRSRNKHTILITTGNRL